MRKGIGIKSGYFLIFLKVCVLELDTSALLEEVKMSPGGLARCTAGDKCAIKCSTSKAVSQAAAALTPRGRCAGWDYHEGVMRKFALKSGLLFCRVCSFLADYEASC